MKQFIILLVLLFFSYNIFAQYSKQNTSVGMTISLPLLNNFRYYDYSNKASAIAWGGLGIGGSIFYKHDKIKYSLNFIAATTYDLSYYDHYDFRVVNIEALIYYSLYKKLNLIGGLNRANYFYTTVGYIPYNYNFEDKTVGITTGLEYMFSKTFSIAAYYRPALYSDGIKSYKRNLSLDARFDIRFWNKK